MQVDTKFSDISILKFSSPSSNVEKTIPEEIILNIFHFIDEKGPLLNVSKQFRHIALISRRDAIQKIKKAIPHLTDSTKLCDAANELMRLNDFTKVKEIASKVPAEQGDFILFLSANSNNPDSKESKELVRSQEWKDRVINRLAYSGQLTKPTDQLSKSTVQLDKLRKKLF